MNATTSTMIHPPAAEDGDHNQVGDEDDEDDGAFANCDDNDTWWDCDPTLIALEELVDNDEDGSEVDGDDSDYNDMLQIDGDSVINDPSIYSFTQPVDMSSITPSIFNDNSNSNNMKKRRQQEKKMMNGHQQDQFGNEADEESYFDTCEEHENMVMTEDVRDTCTTPIDLLEDAVSKIEDHVTLVGTISSSNFNITNNSQNDKVSTTAEQQQQQHEVARDERLKDIFIKANQDDIANILAKEMNKLSMEEQLDGCKDVHGVLGSRSTATDPTKMEDVTATAHSSIIPPSTSLPSRGMEETKIFELMVELAASSGSGNTASSNREAYDLAMLMDSNYVQDPKFLLMFLRADNYNIQKTIWRLMHHFRIKLELFGKELLVRDITLDDLDENDIKVLNTGIHQYLPQRDHANRVVTIFPTTLATTLTKEMYMSRSRYRAMWYTCMIIRHDEFSQINGSIVVILNMKKNQETGKTRTASPSSKNLTTTAFDSFGKIYYASQSKWYSDALPYKISAMHCFYDEKTIGYKFMSIFYFLYQSRLDNNVTRFLPHYTPTLQDVISKLQSYGIPTMDLPLLQEKAQHEQQHGEQQRRLDYKKIDTSTSPAIRLALYNHHQWVERQRIIEMATKIRKQQIEDYRQKIKNDCTYQQANNTNKYIVGPPQKFDVLLGRGSRCAQHPGNIRAFTIADMNRKHYDQLSKHEKTRYSEQLVHQIQASGGRFLKKAVVVDSGGGTRKRAKFESYSWVEATQEEAREKVSHIFRRLRELDTIKSKPNKATTSSAKRKVATT